MHSIYWTQPKRKRTWIVLTITYLAVALWAIYRAFATDFKLAELEPMGRWLVVVGGLVFSLLPTFYWWRESWHFEEWIATTTLTPAQLELEKERFKSNRELARSCWTAIVATFTAFLINVK